MQDLRDSTTAQGSQLLPGVFWNQKNNQRPLRDLSILDAKATRKGGSVPSDGRPTQAADDRIVGRRRAGDPNQQAASGFGGINQALQAQDCDDQRLRVKR